MSGSAAALANVIQTVPIGLRAPGAVVGRGPEAVASTYSQTVLSLNPSGYWRLNEASGNFADSAGGNILTPTGALTYGVTGPFRIDAGTAIAVGGVAGNYAGIAHPTYLDGLAAMTAAWWTKPTAIGDNQCFLSSWNYSTQGQFSYQTDQGGASSFKLYVAATLNDAGNNFFSPTASQLLTNGAWAFVVVVYDGTLAAANRMALYVNGTYQPGSVTGTIPTALLSPDSTAELRVSDWKGVGRAINGAIADVAIFPRALTPTQIAQLWHVGLGR